MRAMIVLAALLAGCAYANLTEGGAQVRARFCWRMAALCDADGTP